MQESLDEVYNAAVQLLQPLDVEQTYEITITECVRLAQANYGTLYIAQQGKLTKVFSTIPAKLQMTPAPGGKTYKALRTKKIYIYSKDELKSIHPEIANSPINSVIVVPLTSGNQTIGVLNLQSTQSVEFNIDRLRVLKLYSTLATLKLRNIELLSELQEALQMRDLFISMASHELKTPMTAIYAYIQLVRKKVLQNQVPDRDWIDIIMRETKRLSSLVNELLQVNQIRTAKLKYTFKTIYIRDVIRQALQNFKSTHQERIVKFRDSAPRAKGIILADSDKLLQVIINLLNNAAKFSSADKSIKLILAITTNEVVIRIKDQGTGIPPKDLPHIFEEFYKGRGNAKEGLGLGLFISKTIIDQHKGTIKVTSHLRKGTTFSICLPKLKNAQH